MSNEEIASLIQQGINVTDNMSLLYEQTERFIFQVAKRYKTFMEIEDLTQQGFLGLYEAAQKYDPATGMKFLTYAEHWIKQSMVRYIENNGNTVRIPVYNHNRMLQYDKLVKNFACEHGRKPTDLEICEYLNISMKQLKSLEVDRCMHSISSTDNLVSEDNDNLTIGDTIASTEDIEASVIDKMAAGQLKAIIWPEVERLPESQSNTLKYRYHEGMTLDATGQVMGVHKETVRQHEIKGLKTLKRKRNIIRLAKEYDIITTKAYGGGVSSFNRTWTSSTEYSAMKIMSM